MSKPDRDLLSLHPIMRDRVVALQAALESAGLPFQLYETLRGRARQGAGHANGTSGAGMWQSYHQYGLAADFVGRVAGKWTWDGVPWLELGRLAKSVGLDWGGDWKKPVDCPHVQIRGIKPSGKVADPALLPDRLDEWGAWTARFVALADLALGDDRKVFVMALQSALNFRGAGLVVDGAWGPKTKDAQLKLVGVDTLDTANWPAIVRAVKEE